MIAVSLFDALVREVDADPDCASSLEVAQLASKYVESSLADWQRILECENQIGATSSMPPATRAKINRSLYDVYRNWANEAEQVLSRARTLANHGHEVTQAAALEHAFGRVQARLKLAPETVERAMSQIDAGGALPIVDLRGEIHSRIRP